jgi:hypothetical protein
LFLYQGGIPSTQLLLFCEPKVSPRNDGNWLKNHAWTC